VFLKESVMRALRRLCFLAVLSVLTTAAPASAQVVHSLQIGGGIFFPRGMDARDSQDVLARNYFGVALPDLPTLTDALAFRIGDFRRGLLFGEWNVGFGDHVEVGAGLGFYRRTVPTVYLDLVDENFREIEQELRLQMIPISGVVRFIAFRPGQVQPYVGAGVSAVAFRYSEIGDFVDGDTLDVFSDRFTTSGVAPGALLVGGLRVPVGGDIYGMGIEYRHQFAIGDTGGSDNGFLADTIDLSGGSLNFSFLVRF
jgi:opacity protein-like surface antigen